MTLTGADIIKKIVQAATDRCRERIAAKKKADMVWTGCGGRDKPDNLRRKDG